MEVIKASDGETVERSAAEIFRGGPVWFRSLTGAGGSGDFNVAMVQFAAGAHTALHRHTSDQVLYVVAGIGKVGDEDGEHVITAGDSVVVPAGAEHWHGAHDTGSPMSHISITAASSETTVTGD